MTLTEKASYLKGLAEGMELDGKDKQSKLMLAMIDLIDDMAITISDLEDRCTELSEQLDAVDEDLAGVEDELYGDEEDEDDDDFYEVECPACNDTIYLDEDMIEKGGITCPNCGTELEFDLSDDECECDCEDCAHDEEKSDEN